MVAPVVARVLDRRSRWTFGVCGVLAVLFLLTEMGLHDLLVASAIAFGLLPFTAAAVLLLDRVQPEPLAVLAWTFCAGATAVLLWAVVLNSGVEAALTPLLGEGTSGEVGSVVVAPLVEESGKAAVLLVVLSRFRHQLSGPLDGVVYAAAVGLGFSTVEDVLYYGLSADEGDLVGTVVVRGVLSPFGHPLFTAFTGLGLGLLVAGRTRWGRAAPVVGFAVAVALHALWNGSTEADSAVALLVLPVVMLPALVGLVLLCRREAGRERRLIRQHLAGEVAAGVLTIGDLDTFAEVRPRRLLLRALRRAGADGTELVTTALSLVELRERLARGVGGPSAVADHAVLTERLVTARRALPPAISPAGLGEVCRSA